MYRALLTTALLVSAEASLFFDEERLRPSLSVSYARDENSDKVTNDCLLDMYPRNLYPYPLKIERNDVPCIIHCVLKKFGIMSADGDINIRNYYRRVDALHRHDPRIQISDVGETCAQNIESMKLDHDVCKKAKVFNDCTQLYAVSLRDPGDW